MAVYPLSSIDFNNIQDGWKIKSNFSLSIRSSIPRGALPGMPKGMNQVDGLVLGKDADDKEDPGGCGNDRGAKILFSIGRLFRRP
jgi:hypothetical protein